jgi:hypothetical protein
MWLPAVRSRLEVEVEPAVVVELAVALGELGPVGGSAGGEPARRTRC